MRKGNSPNLSKGGGFKNAMIATSVFRLIYSFVPLSVRRIFVRWSLMRFKTSGSRQRFFSAWGIQTGPFAAC